MFNSHQNFSSHDMQVGTICDLHLHEHLLPSVTIGWGRLFPQAWVPNAMEKIPAKLQRVRSRRKLRSECSWGRQVTNPALVTYAWESVYLSRSADRFINPRADVYVLVFRVQANLLTFHHSTESFRTIARSALSPSRQVL